MKAELTSEPDADVRIVDREGDRWEKAPDGSWVCVSDDYDPLHWYDLSDQFGPLRAASGVTGVADEVREFEVRRAALLAAATAFKRDGELEDDWEDHEASIVAKARKFEPYLRGEAK